VGRDAKRAGPWYPRWGGGGGLFPVVVRGLWLLAQLSRGATFFSVGRVGTDSSNGASNRGVPLAVANLVAGEETVNSVMWGIKLLLNYDTDLSDLLLLLLKYVQQLKGFRSSKVSLQMTMFNDDMD